MSEEIEKSITGLGDFTSVILNNKVVMQSVPKRVAPRTTSNNGSNGFYADPQATKVVAVSLNKVVYPFEDTDTLDKVLILTETINNILSLIPNQATADNKLADKGFVNSSIATNTANLITDNGQPFSSVEALEAYSGTLTNNDYAFVTETDSSGNLFYNRYKYNANTSSWSFEYKLNNSTFTASQWNTINSGLTSQVLTDIQELQTQVAEQVTETVNVETTTTATPTRNTVYIFTQDDVALTLGNMSVVGKRILVMANADGCTLTYNDYEGQTTVVEVHGGSSITLYSTSTGYIDRHYGAVWN